MTRQILWIGFGFALITVAYNSAGAWSLFGGEEASDPYWNFQAWTTYLTRFFWALTITVWVSIDRPAIKYFGLASTFSLGIDLIDLATTGDYNPNPFDTLFWFAGVPYSIISYIQYSKALVSDPIEPEAVYVVSNPPRDLVQLIGSFTPIGRGRGNVAVWYNGGYYFASTRSGKYERHELNRVILREGQVIKRLDVNPEEFEKWWNEWEGRKYSWWNNCFRSVRDLDKRKP